MVEAIAGQPTLYHAGYTQDAFKELVEAHLVNAVSRGLPLPTPGELFVTGPTYLRGMSEAATEMRRFVLDLMRRGQVVEAEQYLEFMDEVYSHLDHRRLSRRRHRRPAPPHRYSARRARTHARRPDHGHSPGPDARGAARLRAQSRPQSRHGFCGHRPRERSSGR